MGKRVYLGLGSNLGNKERIVRKAIDKIGERVGAGAAGAGPSLPCRRSIRRLRGAINRCIRSVTLLLQ